METKRLAFHEILVELLGSRNVYFQPPSSGKIQYPCIIYSLNDIYTKQANNQLYGKRVCYSVMLIGNDITKSETFEKLLQLPLCKFNRHYTADNLNHDVFSIYY